MNWPISTFISVAILSITSLIIWNNYKAEIVKANVTTKTAVIERVVTKVKYKIDKKCLRDVVRLRRQMSAFTSLKRDNNLLKSRGCHANWKTGEAYAYAGSNVKHIRCIFDQNNRSWKKVVINKEDDIGLRRLN